MTQFILALCGLPASGKSNLADAIQKALDFDVEIVRTDEWRDEAYYTDWLPKKEGIVRARALTRVKQFVAEGKNIIHDDTNYYTSMRHELYAIALENKCGFVIIHVNTSVETALKWNRARQFTDIPDSVIEDISERFDSPGKRYLWDNADLEVDMERDDVDTVVLQIVEILDELEPVMKPRPRLITSTEYEQLDAKTRLVVSEFLEKHPELRGHREVSIIRRDILRNASESRVPLEGIHDLLWTALSKLL